MLDLRNPMQRLLLFWPVARITKQYYVSLLASRPIVYLHRYRRRIIFYLPVLQNVLAYRVRPTNVLPQRLNATVIHLAVSIPLWWISVFVAVPQEPAPNSKGKGTSVRSQRPYPGSGGTLTRTVWVARIAIAQNTLLPARGVPRLARQVRCACASPKSRE